MNKLNDSVHQLLKEQKKEWPLIAKNFSAVEHILSRTIQTDSYPVVLQFNAERIRSSTAKVDARSLKARPCFLCPQNLHVEQRGIPFGKNYRIMINPYPIFPEHLTISVNEHIPQRIAGRIDDMLQMAEQLDDFVIFYNGPHAGASAPDHMHFQAGNKGLLPAEINCSKAEKCLVKQTGAGALYLLPRFQRNSLLIKTTERKDAVSLFNEVYAELPQDDGESEPMLNILCWQVSGEWQLLVMPRQQLRPSCYYATDESRRLVSPASVEMGGLFILPLQEDFERITAGEIEQILDEVSLNEKKMNEIISKIKGHDK